MPLDLSRFAKAFFEEAQEHISALESLLVAVNLRAPDPEALNAIFRAVHSVKGGAAAFGHMALSEFTHDFESILDRVRKGKLTLTKPMVNTFLKAGDVMRRHLLALEQDKVPDVAEMKALRESLIDLTAEELEPPPLLEEPEPAPPPRFRIEIHLEKAQYEASDSLDELKTDIAGLGEVLEVSTQSIDDRLLAFGFQLNTEIDADELRESLEFIVPAEAITITANERRAGRTVTATVAPAAEPDKNFGFFDDDADGGFGFFDSPAAEAEPARAIAATPHPSAEPDVQLSSLVDASSIRVNVAKVDQLINLVGELVIAEAMVSQAASGLDPNQQTRLAAGLAQLERNTRDLQDAILAIRMLPISFVFSRLPRLTRDLADRLGKEVELEMLGEDTELDKSVIEKIADPLTHLVRNAIDHGIETPAERVANGKPATGMLTVRAAHQGGSIAITVTDDGAGLNRDKIVAKARELGLDAGESWSDEEIWQLIFTPGFSTAKAVTDVSGRGVGMDVVWQNVHMLGGKIEIDSIPGQGTSMMIRLPLTLAILDGMSVAVSGETYILPLANIAQSLQPESSDIKTVNGSEVVMVRDEYLPITSVAELFNLPPAEKQEREGILVVLEMDDKRAAVRVDDLLGQHQVVLKSLEANFRRVKGVTGATILGDGRVAFILDAGYLVSVAHSVAREKSAVALGD
jgi:two-component system, chemotaxis family, sensor kinase CheA